MTKKIFLFLPLAILFTACSNKGTQVNLDQNNAQDNKMTVITLSYGEYKKLYDAKNKKVKNRPTENYEVSVTPKEYKKLFASENENIVSKAVEIPETKKEAFIDFYSEWKDVKYKMGGSSKSGIDCSAFTQKVYKEKFGVDLPRTTRTQVDIGVEVQKSDLAPGDLVFFKTGKTDRHVGVYVGNGNFMHASIKGVTFTKLDKPFYKKNYWTSRRIID